jgi:excisionase family DNA binding protein
LQSCFMHQATQFLLTSEVSRLLDVSAQTIRLWERLGRLRATKTEKGVRLFSRADVEQLALELERQRNQGTV